MTQKKTIPVPSISYTLPGTDVQAKLIPKVSLLEITSGGVIVVSCACTWESKEVVRLDTTVIDPGHLRPIVEVLAVVGVRKIVVPVELPHSKKVGKHWEIDIATIIRRIHAQD